MRHHLVQHMISAMQRLGFTPSVTIEQRKLAVDLAEVVIKWELQRIKDQQVCSYINTVFNPDSLRLPRAVLCPVDLYIKTVPPVYILHFISKCTELQH